MLTSEAKDVAIQKVREFLEQELSGRPSIANQTVIKIKAFSVFPSDLQPVPDRIVIPINRDYEDDIVRGSRSDPDKWEAARRLAVSYLLRGESLPEKLATFVVEILHGSCPKPSARNRNQLRNIILTRAVFQLAQVEGICATRNESTEDRESACDIVARLMRELGHSRVGPVTVKKIWEKHSEHRRILEFIDSVFREQFL